MSNNPIQELGRLGQSIWLDYIRRSLMTTGELERLIQEDGLRGMTSNPTIFEKAIAGTNEYDDSIRALVMQGKGAQEIYDALVLEDIGRAADLLLPIFKATSGIDGFVSIEVSPELAYDTEGSIREARRYISLLNRPNIMVKVPGTPQGLPAIEALIAEGVNVNVTLLFGLENYEQVMEAYLRGLEKRASQQKPLGGVASVASFFVSRVDTLVDERLKERLQETTNPGEREKIQQLFGKIAVANARMAYHRFKQFFSSQRFKSLEAKGARAQRPLWGSTSTKNPDYSDILYVQELIGKDSVNTVPPETFRAFQDHGQPRLTIEENLEEARVALKSLAEAGIDLREVTTKLQEDGVRLFSDSFRKLIRSIAMKHEALLAGLPSRQEARAADSSPTQRGSLGAEAAMVQSPLHSLQKEEVVRRLWEKDPTLWKKDPQRGEAIRERLGWLTVPEVMRKEEESLSRFAREIKKEGFTDLLLLGMGGSSLCPEVLRETFGKVEGFPELHVLDSTDPATILEAEKKINLARTLFLISSKSGGTTETDSLFRYFYQKVPDGSNFIAITDPGTSLEEQARSKKFRRTFANPPDIGGRYSALSYFGLVPAALMGLDPGRLLRSAGRMAQSCRSEAPLSENPGALLGAILGDQARKGRDKVTLVASRPMDTFGLWVEQLLAESTGKEGKGIVPVEGEPLGPPGVYGDDRLFVYASVRNHQEQETEKKVQALEKAGCQLLRILLNDPYDLGGEFFRWEFATAVAGSILEIDPFDQPNVQESKDNTRSLLERFKKDGNLPEETPLLEEDGLRLFADPALFKDREREKRLGGLLSSFLENVRTGDYVAFMAYIQKRPAHDEKIQAIRLLLRDKLRVATTVGYGPRFLHSTGQLHKGGGNNGIFIQLTCDDGEDLPIPGEELTFSLLKQAQALGDYSALLKHRRRLIRIHLGKDTVSGLQRILSSLEEVVTVRR